MKSKRKTATTVHVRAGCFTCHGTSEGWAGTNAQGIAARHSDTSGHVTWCETTTRTLYGDVL